jgi:GH35 family endo-1,4-beta-xylanase
MSINVSLSKSDTAGIQLFATAMILCILFSGSNVFADWESDANARIEQIRKRNAQITVVDSLGNPVPGLYVQISQIKHRFAFGTCIASSRMSNNSYKNFILDHFEWAVCENEAKWEWNEPSRDSVSYSDADIIYNWCAANDITMRGHCLFWEQPGHVQTWVQNLPYATYPNSSQLLDEVDERIDSAVNHFKNKYVHWDVNNEMLSDDFYSRLGEAGRVHMYQAANAIDPACKFFANEYAGNSFGGYDGWTYRNRLNSLIGMGAPVEGIGIQGHMASPVDAQRYYDDVLEPLAEVGLPIFVTEFDVQQANVTQRANDLENFFRICFSHPSVEGIIMWGFWEDSQWRTDAYIVDSNWNINQAGLRYEALLDEWTTTDSGVGDDNGEVDVRGFHGTYEITLSVPGEPAEVHTIELEPGTGTALFELETALESPEPDTTPPAAPTGLSAAAGSGIVYLTWNANTENDLDGYNVYRSTTSGSEYSRIAERLEGPAYTDDAVSNGTTYYYVVTALDFSANESGYSNEDDAAPEFGTGQNPYPGPAAYSIPGRIEAENYDLGGEGVAFHDTDTNNEGGDYRSDGVDVETCGEGGYNVGWIQTGEWLEYTVDVALTGTYDIELRVASDSGGGDLHIEFDGNDVTGTLSFAPTGGWQNYISIYADDVYLTRGLHIMRIAMDATYFNINWLEFTGGPALYGDFDENGIVNIDDLPSFMQYWFVDDCDWDLNGNCRVDLYEFSVLSQNWEL